VTNFHSVVSMTRKIQSWVATGDASIWRGNASSAKGGPLTERASLMEQVLSARWTFPVWQRPLTERVSSTNWAEEHFTQGLQEGVPC
jgi:hypothetical protein